MDKLEVIKKPIEKELSEFKAIFDASLKSSTPLLDEVLGYIKQRNGKMMRPILVLLMANFMVELTIPPFMLRFRSSCFILPVWYTMMW